MKIEKQTKTTVIKAKKIKTKKPEVKVVVGKPLVKKSDHVVNLKNPHPNFVPEPKTNQILKFKPQKSQQKSIKPPKVSPPKTEKIGVDFLTRQNKISELFSELSLINLFQLIFQPLIKLIKIFKKKTSVNRPRVKPKKEIEEIEDIFAPPTDFKFLDIYIPKSWYKSVGVFIIISLVLVLPFQVLSYQQYLQETKDKVLVLTNEAINNLAQAQQAASSFDLTTAGQEFDQAKRNFILAQAEISQINIVTTEIIKLLPSQNKTMEAGLTILSVGEKLAEVGQILTSAGNNFLAQQGTNYYQSLLNLKVDLGVGIAKFLEAKDLIEKIDIADLPAEHQSTFNQVLIKLPVIESGLTDLYTLNSAILKILGEKQWQRYLIIFVNNNELRGGGGFMGSFALVDIDRGQIKKMDIPAGGTYDIQGQLLPKVISPEPLHLINPRWEFQDANWWPDFPTTAKKIQWFYQNASGPSTDGVIVMTASMMSQFLSVLGPIQVSEYELTVDSDNFIATTQEVIKQFRDEGSSRPKQFIADLAPELLERLFSIKGESLKELFTILHQGLNEKHLLLYFNDPQLENVISSLDWAGKLKQTEGDFLSVVHTNLAGGKTDEVIEEIIDHQAEVLTDGSIINTVKLTRIHNGIPGENIFTGIQNNSYVRFYVPAGSTLIEASGFAKPAEKYFEEPPEELTPDIDLISIETDHFFDETTGTDIYKESGKTVFGNWLQLKPSETQEATIKYKLPFKLSQAGQSTFYYSLLAQKQNGSRGSKLISRLYLNDQLKLLTKYPSSLKGEEKTIEFSGDLITDQFYGVTLISK